MRVTDVVRTISQPYIESWKKRVGPEEARRRLDYCSGLGTLVHDFAFQIHTEGCADISFEAPAFPIVSAYEKFFRETVKEVLWAEGEIRHPLYGYKGHPDLIARLFNDKVALIDLKTGPFSKIYRLQLAGYREAWNYLHKDDPAKKITQSFLVILGKEAKSGKCDVKNLRSHDKDFKHFLYALALERYFNN